MNINVNGPSDNDKMWAATESYALKMNIIVILKNTIITTFTFIDVIDLLPLFSTTIFNAEFQHSDTVVFV